MPCSFPWMNEVRETRLPGVGIRYEFTTTEGQRIGVIHHRSGLRELLVYDEVDPDACRAVIRLAEDDTRTLNELLGGSRVTQDLQELQRRVHGLATEWLPIVAQTPYAGKTIADTEARSRTGVSIVAVVRGEATFASPAPDFRLEAGDIIAVVGTPRGIEDLVVLLRSS